MSAECVRGQSWVLQSQSVLFQCVSASRASALPETLALVRGKGGGSDNAFCNACGSHALVVRVTQAELEKAKSTTDFYKDAYWKCLADEILRAVPTSMSAQEFSVLAKSACPKER